ncbi:ATP-binding protein [Streptomyces sp. NPDC059578]
MPTHRRTFTGLPQEIGHARRWARSVLGGHPCTDDALLVVTELGTNAIAHTASRGGSFLLAVNCSETAVTVTVTDSGGTSTRPHVEHPDDEAFGGRGLALVTAYATRVRIRGDHRGHTITVELCAKASESAVR